MNIALFRYIADKFRLVAEGVSGINNLFLKLDDGWLGIRESFNFAYTTMREAQEKERQEYEEDFKNRKGLWEDSLFYHDEFSVDDLHYLYLGEIEWLSSEYLRVENLEEELYREILVDWLEETRFIGVYEWMFDREYWKDERFERLYNRWILEPWGWEMFYWEDRFNYRIIWLKIKKFVYFYFLLIICVSLVEILRVEI